MDTVSQNKRKRNWKELSRQFPASSEEAEKARSLFISFEKNGYLKSVDFSLDNCSKGVIIDFFYRLSLLRSIDSPVKRKKKSSWIHDRDFAFLNHRNLSFIDRFPLFSQLSILPAIRSSAIILAPFTKKVMNAVDSHSIISADFEDKEMISMGFSRDDQFLLFIEAIHLLGKCVGYSLDYRVGRFAVPVLIRPDLFRWIDINCSDSYRDMLSEKSQAEIVNKVNIIVRDHLNRKGTEPGDKDYREIREKLIREGVWTVPSCNGEFRQLPVYNTSLNSQIPQFDGGDEDLTSFKFFLAYQDGELIRPGTSINYAALEYYSSLYIKWRDRFSFDFVKFYGIDFADDEEGRKADGPSLELLKKVIKKSTGKISHTGMVGNRCGNFEKYLAAGFTTVSIKEESSSINQKYMENNFDIYNYQMEMNKNKRKQLSVLLDWGKNQEDSQFPLDDCCRRIFISRFISCSDSFRPKYEPWNKTGDNKNLSDIPLYHFVENIYTRYRDIIRKGEIAKHFSNERISWWIIHSGANLLIPVVSLDVDDNIVPGSIEIDYSGIIKTSRILSVLEYDFTSPSGNLFLCGDEKIRCEGLPYKQFRLYSVQ